MSSLQAHVYHYDIMQVQVYKYKLVLRDKFTIASSHQTQGYNYKFTVPYENANAKICLHQAGTSMVQACYKLVQATSEVVLVSGYASLHKQNQKTQVVSANLLQACSKHSDGCVSLCERAHTFASSYISLCELILFQLRARNL